MKRRAILQSLLVLFPVLAVGLATTSDSVTVFDTVSGQTSYYSYFDILPVGNLQLITVVTALCSVFSGVLAAVYLAKKKEMWLKGAGYAAIASATLAAIPVVLRNQVMIIPNVALPIFMIMQFGVAYYLQKAAPAVKENKKQNRLPRR